jgi:hypothetical protein
LTAAAEEIDQWTAERSIDSREIDRQQFNWSIATTDRSHLQQQQQQQQVIDRQAAGEVHH